MKSRWAYITAIVVLGAALTLVGTYVAEVTDDGQSQTDATQTVPVSDPATGPIVYGGGSEVISVSAAKGGDEGTEGELPTGMAMEYAKTLVPGLNGPSADGSGAVSPPCADGLC